MNSSPRQSIESAASLSSTTRSNSPSTAPSTIALSDHSKASGTPERPHSHTSSASASPSSVARGSGSGSAISPELAHVLRTYRQLASGTGARARTSDADAADDDRDATWRKVNISELEAVLGVESAQEQDQHVARWRADKAREEWDRDGRLLRLRMPSPIHDTFVGVVGDALLDKIRAAARVHCNAKVRQLEHYVEGRNTSDVYLQEGKLKYSPDWSLAFSPRGSTPAEEDLGEEAEESDSAVKKTPLFPCLVVEGAFSNPIDEEKAMNYIEYSEGWIRTVIFFEIGYCNLRGRLSKRTPYALHVSVFKLVPSNSDADPPSDADQPCFEVQKVMDKVEVSGRHQGRVELSWGDLQYDLAGMDGTISLTFGELRRLLVRAVRVQRRQDEANTAQKPPTPPPFAIKKRARSGTDEGLRISKRVRGQPAD